MRMFISGSRVDLALPDKIAPPPGPATGRHTRRPDGRTRVLATRPDGRGGGGRGLRPGDKASPTLWPVDDIAVDTGQSPLWPVIIQLSVASTHLVSLTPKPPGVLDRRPYIRQGPPGRPRHGPLSLTTAWRHRTTTTTRIKSSSRLVSSRRSLFVNRLLSAFPLAPIIDRVESLILPTRPNNSITDAAQTKIITSLVLLFVFDPTISVLWYPKALWRHDCTTP